MERAIQLVSVAKRPDGKADFHVDHEPLRRLLCNPRVANKNVRPFIRSQWRTVTGPL